MNVIYTDRIIACIASNEDSSYPDSNLLDEHPKKVWKSTGVSATLTIDMSSGAALGIVNTNATGVNVSVVTAIILELSSDISALDGLEMETVPGDGTVEATLLNTDTGDIWISWSAANSPIQVSVSLTSTASPLYAGVVAGGDVFELSDPLYGLQETMVDYSVVKELSNGSLYYRRRDLVRQYSPTVMDDRDGTVLAFMRQIVRWSGPAPLMWRLTSLDNSQWIVFARLTSPPAVTHNYPIYSTINFTVSEVV